MALFRQALIAEKLTQKGISLTQKEFDALYRNRKTEPGTIRINKVMATILHKRGMDDIDLNEFLNIQKIID